jgi:hypothetical protein
MIVTFNSQCMTSDFDVNQMPMQINPYTSPSSEVFVDPQTRGWVGGAKSELIQKGLLYRKVLIEAPIPTTIEYAAYGLRDRIYVDGKLVTWRVPLIWFTKRFAFEIATRDSHIPCEIHVRIGRGLKLAELQIMIGGITAYHELSGEKLCDEKTSPSVQN